MTVNPAAAGGGGGGTPGGGGNTGGTEITCGTVTDPTTFCANNGNNGLVDNAATVNCAAATCQPYECCKTATGAPPPASNNGNNGGTTNTNGGTGNDVTGGTTGTTAAPSGMIYAGPNREMSIKFTQPVQ